MKQKDEPQDATLTAGKNVSYWTDSIHSEEQLPLEENLETEVVIVGGGIAGLTTAYCLLRSGKKIVLLEDGDLGSGETGRTTAHLVTALDDRYYHLEKIFGKEKTKLIAESHQAGIDLVEEIVQAENIACDFERLNGYLFLHPSDKKDSLEKELVAASNAGVEVKLILSPPGLPGSENALCFFNQAQFHPLKYLQGLRKAILEKGGKIYTATHVSKMEKEGVTTSAGYKVKAKYTVVATNAPVNSHLAMPLKQYAYRTYVIAALVKKNSVPKALWWDTGDFTVNSRIPPYHYLRTHNYNNEFDVLISGGEDHPIGHTDKTHVPEEDRYIALEKWTKEHFKIENIIYRWSGQVMEPIDGIAFIGHSPFDEENIFMITGDSGNGMTHCSFGALLITDLINGKENKWEKLYSPMRFTIKESGPVVKAFVHDTKNLLKKMFHSGSVELSSIKYGGSGIVEMDGKKFGAYRDDKGKLYLVSTECTHAGCTVVWNNDEKSWDCPCHGSRFTCEGKVMNGPANKDLPSYYETKMKEKIKE